MQLGRLLFRWTPLYTCLKAGHRDGYTRWTAVLPVQELYSSNI